MRQCTPTPNTVYVFGRGITLSGRADPNQAATVPCRLQLYAVLGGSSTDHLGSSVLLSDPHSIVLYLKHLTIAVLQTRRLGAASKRLVRSHSAAIVMVVETKVAITSLGKVFIQTNGSEEQSKTLSRWSFSCISFGTGRVLSIS